MDPFSLSSLIKIVKNERLNRKIWQPVEHILGFKKLSKLYQEVESQSSTDAFIPAALKKLNIDYEIVKPIATIPQTGPLIVVSNHPFGALEALLLLDHLSKYREDVKVMANLFLQRITAVSDHIFGVNPFKDARAKKSNHRVMKELYEWLLSEHCLITFPAGNVAHVHVKKTCVTDPIWDEQIAHLARSTNAAVLPIYIEGRNSRCFYLLGPKLHAFRYGNELLNKQNRTIKIHIGSVICSEQTKSIKDDRDLINYFRLKSDQLPLSVQRDQ